MALRAVRLAHVALVESTSVATETLETDNWLANNKRSGQPATV